MLQKIVLLAFVATASCLSPLQKTFVGTSESEIASTVPGTLNVAEEKVGLKGSYSLGDDKLAFSGTDGNLFLELQNGQGFEVKSGNDFIARRSLPDGLWNLKHGDDHFQTSTFRNNFADLEVTPISHTQPEAVDQIMHNPLFATLVTNLAVKLGASGYGGHTHQTAGAIAHLGHGFYTNHAVTRGQANVHQGHVDLANQVAEHQRKHGKVPTKIMELQAETDLSDGVGSGGTVHDDADDAGVPFNIGDYTGFEDYIGGGSCSYEECNPATCCGPACPFTCPATCTPCSGFSCSPPWWKYSSVSCSNSQYGACGDGANCWKFICGDCCCHGGCLLHDFTCSCVDLFHEDCYTFVDLWINGGGCGCGDCPTYQTCL